MPLEPMNSSISRTVRVRETQEYDVEVATSRDDRDAASLARRIFMNMTAVEQAESAVGITERSFDEFDEDELTLT